MGGSQCSLSCQQLGVSMLLASYLAHTTHTFWLPRQCLGACGWFWGSHSNDQPLYWCVNASRWSRNALQECIVVKGREERCFSRDVERWEIRRLQVLHTSKDECRSHIHSNSANSGTRTRAESLTCCSLGCVSLILTFHIYLKEFCLLWVHPVTVTEVFMDLYRQIP